MTGRCKLALLGAAAEPGGLRNTQATRKAMNIEDLGSRLAKLVSDQLLERSGRRRSYVFTISARGREVLAAGAQGKHALPRLPLRRADSLTQRVQAYFEANAEEELCYTDMALKFGAGIDQLRWSVQVLSRRGLLESVHVVRRRDSEAATGRPRARA